MIPSIYRSASSQRQATEWIWSFCGIIMTGENRSIWRKMCPSTTLSTTNPICIGLESNPGKNKWRLSGIFTLAHMAWCFIKYRAFFPTWPISSGPILWWVFMRLSKGYYHCDRLPSSRHQLLNLPDMLHTAQRWQTVRRTVRPAFIGQAGRKKNTSLYKDIFCFIVENQLKNFQKDITITLCFVFLFFFVSICSILTFLRPFFFTCVSVHFTN
jgi:hypothetical protein